MDGPRRRAAPAGPPARAAAWTARTMALAAALSFAPAHAALFADDDARRAILELRGKVDAQAQDTQRRLDALTTRIEQIERNTGRGQLELASQLEQMRQEIARLRGQVEVQNNELSGVQRRQKDLAENVDTRLKPFEPVQVQIDGQTFTVDPADKRAYDQALAQFRASDFKAALAGFQSLLKNPDSPYAPAAQFWAGSAQFALRDWKGAAASLQALLARHPDTPRAPDALLTLASAQLEQGDRRAARATLQSLLDKHPQSPAAETARQRLDSIPAGGR